LKLERC